METLLRKWDGECTIVKFDRPTGAWIFIAIHSTRLGPATGGTRMMFYPDPKAALQDALRLAAGMTYKFAVPGFPRGGGKAVVAIPPDLKTNSRANLLRRYGSLIHDLQGLYYTGPDVGTSPEDMDIIAETGAPYVFCCTPAKGGAGGSGPATALGVFAGMQAVCEHVFGNASLRGRQVLVQGVGSVGEPLIERLLAADAIVFFSDVDEVVVRHFRDENGLPFVPPETVYDTPCDIFAPCALGGILNKENIPRLKCRAVVGAANNQLGHPEDAENLEARGILYAPDYVVNVGGAMAITGMEAMGWSSAQAETEVMRVRSSLEKVFELADTDGITTEAAARRIAEKRLSMAPMKKLPTH